jgi:GTP-binding protein
MIEEVAAAVKMKIGTGRLNRFIAKLLQLRHPPMIQGRRLRIYYMTQIGVQPPTFVLFVNRTELMESSYQRFLLNQLRKEFNFSGTPLKVRLRGKAVEGQSRKSRKQGSLEAITPLLAREGTHHHDSYGPEVECKEYDDYEEGEKGTESHHS